MDCLNDFYNDNISEVIIPTESLLFDITHIKSMLYPYVFPKNLFHKINSKKMKLIKPVVNKEKYSKLSDSQIDDLKKKYFSEGTIVIGISSPISIINFPISLFSSIEILRNRKCNIEVLLLQKPIIGKFGITTDMYNKIINCDWVKIIEVEEKDKLNYLKMCDMLASTCRDYSNHVNHTITIQEYMLCNRPIICSRGKEIETLLGKNYFGFYDCHTCNVVPPIFYMDFYKKSIKPEYDSWKICKTMFNDNVPLPNEVNSILNIIQNSINLNKFNKIITNTSFFSYKNIPKIPVTNRSLIYKDKTDNYLYPDKNVKIVMATCVHGRHKLLKTFLDYSLTLPIYKIVAVYSSPEDKAFLDTYPDVCAVYFKNTPLSKKWNHAIKTCEQYNPSAVVISGSDDLLSRNYINYCKYKITSGYDMIGTKCWTNVFIDKDYYYMCAAHYPIKNDNPLGLGRCISKKLLDKFKWNIYDFNKNKGLDGASFRLLQKYLSKKNYIEKYDYSDALLLKETNDITSVTCDSDFSNIKEYISFLNKPKGALAILVNCSIINYINIDPSSLLLINQFLM